MLTWFLLYLVIGVLITLYITSKPDIDNLIDVAIFQNPNTRGQKSAKFLVYLIFVLTWPWALFVIIKEGI